MNSENPFQIARAYKGEGKSALLRLVRTKLIREGSDEIVATTTGPDLSPPLDSTDHDLWVREWKKSILRIVANEIGSRIGLAFGDDAISLVEESEASGFKKRSFVSAIVDRLSSSAVPIKKSTIAVTNHEKLVKRYLDGRPLIWLIVDDVDLNFANTEKQRLKTATFFTACRQIIGAIPEIRIRTAIRPNVWSIIKREFESLSHVEQYSHDLTWSIDQFRSLLAARVRAELIRSNRWNTISSTLPQETFLREKALVGFVFDDPMPWGGGDRKRPPHVVLFT
ncbi:MAG: hypothetical protein Q8L65_08600, partial [Burkholderiales bacterium]|nr:hypothetical protein [Burkholderiales bacterium]